MNSKSYPTLSAMDLMAASAVSNHLDDCLGTVINNFYRKKKTSVFQQFLVRNLALDRAVLDHGVGPFAELNGPLIVYLEPHRNDYLQIIVIYLAADLALAFRLNYPKFSDSLPLLPDWNSQTHCRRSPSQYSIPRSRNRG